jgi:WD40 repeat protein
MIWVNVFAQNSDVSIAIQQGHMGDVTKIAISADAKFIATYGLDNKIIIWDYKTGSQMACTYVSIKIANLQFGRYQNQLYFSENRSNLLYELSISDMATRRVAAANITFDSKASVKIGNEICTIKEAKIKWTDAATGKKIKTLTCDYFDQPFTSLVYSELHQYTIASSIDGTIYLYNQKHELIKQLKKHNSDVNDIALSPDQKYLYSVSTDRSIIKWDLETLEMAARYSGKNYPAYGLSLNPSANKIMYGDELGNLKTVDLASFRLENTSVQESQFSITQSAQFTDSTYLFAGKDNKLSINWKSNNRTIYRNANIGIKPIVNYVFNEKLGIYQPPFSAYKAVDVNQAANLLVVGTEIHTLMPNYTRIYGLNNPRKLVKTRKLYTKGETTPPTVFFLNDSILFTNYSPTSNKMWKVNSNDLRTVFEKEVNLPVKTELVCRFNDEEVLVYGNSGLYLFNVSDNSKMQIGMDDATKLYDLADDRAAYTTLDNRLYVFSKTEGKVVKSNPFIGHQDEITSAQYNDTKNQIITSSLDGSVKIWDADSAKLLLTIVSIGNDNSIYITPDNFYMMSSKGLLYFGFKKDDKFYYPEQFDPIYNRPDIVLKRLGYADQSLIDAYYRAYQKRLKKLGFTEEMLKSDFHLPTLKLLNLDKIGSNTESEILNLQLLAQDDKYPLDRINVWVNNVAVFGSQGISTKGQNKIEKELAVNLAKGQNKVEVSSVNQAGAESYKETFTIGCSAGKEKPDLYIITIGVSTYNDERFNLKYAAKDANDMIKSFSANTFFNKVYSKKLTNEEVTLENIAALKAFLANAEINDQVIIFVAGHGLLDDKYDYYYASYNMDFKDPAATGVPYEAIEDLLDGIKPLKKLLFMDTCHSGEVDKDDVRVAKNAKSTQDVTARGVGIAYLESNENHLGLINTSDLMKTMFTDLRKGTGATVISASGGLEFALESNDWKNGLFTFCLLNGINQQAADRNNDGEIWLNELQEYVFNSVIELSGGRQTPTFRLENKGLDYRLW